jgi:hypothetical protein
MCDRRRSWIVCLIGEDKNRMPNVYVEARPRAGPKEESRGSGTRNLKPRPAAIY